MTRTLFKAANVGDTRLSISYLVGNIVTGTVLTVDSRHLQERVIVQEIDANRACFAPVIVIKKPLRFCHSVGAEVSNE